MLCLQNYLGSAKNHPDLLHLTPLPCMKIHNFNCSLHSHTLIGSFLTPIGFFRNGVSWNDFGYLELAMQNTGFDQLFLSPTALNVDRYRVSVQIRCKKPMVMEKIVKNG